MTRNKFTRINHEKKVGTEVDIREEALIIIGIR